MMFRRKCQPPVVPNRPAGARPPRPVLEATGPKLRLFAGLDDEPTITALRELDISVPADQRSLILYSKRPIDLSVGQGCSTSLTQGVSAMRVLFADPLTSGCLEADVQPDKTAAQCVEALIDNNYLGAGDYRLVVNGNTVMPHQSLVDAGVTEGSTVAIHKIERGAVFHVASVHERRHNCE